MLTFSGGAAILLLMNAFAFYLFLWLFFSDQEAILVRASIYEEVQGTVTVYPPTGMETGMSIKSILQ